MRAWHGKEKNIFLYFLATETSGYPESLLVIIIPIFPHDFCCCFCCWIRLRIVNLLGLAKIGS